MKGRVCQLFEVFQHEFANLSLPCEGRFTLASWPGGGGAVLDIFLGGEVRRGPYYPDPV